MKITFFVKLNYYNLINIKNLIKHHLLFMQILNVLSKRLINVKIILKIHLQQKWVNIFYKVFQRLQNHHLKHDVYRGKDCMKKFCESLT